MSDIHDILSDMSSHRITIRVPGELEERLRNRSRIKGKTESQVVREALETYLGNSSAEYSAYELAQEAGLIGVVKGAPSDLSTNPRHFAGFGETAQRRRRKK